MENTDLLKNQFMVLIEQIASVAAEDSFAEMVMKDPKIAQKKEETVERLKEEFSKNMGTLFMNHAEEIGRAREYVCEKLALLSPLEREKIENEFALSAQALDEGITEEVFLEKPLWEIVGISEETITWLVSLAQDKESKLSLEERRALFYYLLNLDPLNGSFWLHYALNLREEKRYGETIQALLFAALLEENPSYPYYFLADVSLSMGDKSEAQRYVKDLEAGLESEEEKKSFEPFLEELNKRLSS